MSADSLIEIASPFSRTSSLSRIGRPRLQVSRKALFARTTSTRGSRTREGIEYQHRTQNRVEGYGKGNQRCRNSFQQARQASLPQSEAGQQLTNLRIVSSRPTRSRPSCCRFIVPQLDLPHSRIVFPHRSRSLSSSPLHFPSVLL